MPKLKSGTGPKPSISPRERGDGGHLKPRTDTDRSAPALVRRIMDHAVELGADARCATVLGRLYLQSVLTESEFAAGLLYAEDVGAWERIKGHPRRQVRSPSFDAGYGKADLDLEALERMDPDAAKKIKARMARGNKRIEKRYHKAQGCIPHPGMKDFDAPEYRGIATGTTAWDDRTGTSPLSGRSSVSIRAQNLISTLVEEVCCNDRPINPAHHDMLKAVLNTLAKDCYRLNDPAARTPKREVKPLTAEDLHQLADAAVEAMIDWFRKRQADIAFYRVQHRHDHQSRGFTAYGMTREGSKIENTIKLKRPPGAKGDAIDKALGQAATAHGLQAMTGRAQAVEEISIEALKASIAKLKPEGEAA